MRARHFRAFLTAALCLGAAAGCAMVTDSVPVSYRTLDVLVVDETQLPVANAFVQASGGWYYTGRRAFGTTDAQGRTQLTVPPATYEVEVIPPDGYANVGGEEATRITVDTEPQSVTPVTLTLARKP